MSEQEKREQGYYWVTLNNGREIVAEWSTESYEHGRWYLGSWELAMVTEIGPRVQRDSEVAEWRRVAQLLGEDIGTVGPPGYYVMTPSEWYAWALGKIRSADPMNRDSEVVRERDELLAALKSRVEEDEQQFPWPQRHRDLVDRIKSQKSGVKP